MAACREQLFPERPRCVGAPTPTGVASGERLAVGAAGGSVCAWLALLGKSLEPGPRAVERRLLS